MTTGYVLIPGFIDNIGNTQLVTLRTFDVTPSVASWTFARDHDVGVGTPTHAASCALTPHTLASQFHLVATRTRTP